jgi:hypothetical protein
MVQYCNTPVFSRMSRSARFALGIRLAMISLKNCLDSLGESGGNQDCVGPIYPTVCSSRSRLESVALNTLLEDCYECFKNVPFWKFSDSEMRLPG